MRIEPRIIPFGDNFCSEFDSTILCVNRFKLQSSCVTGIQGKAKTTLKVRISLLLFQTIASATKSVSLNSVHKISIVSV